eukprot:c26713_g1_i2 orf=144-1733(+)
MHPRNRYAENPPDFSLLASLYPDFGKFVSFPPDGTRKRRRGRIDWTDYNATRQLTRVLLDHDYGIKWWIPDGQLCPAVPNRVNYIHWIADLLSSTPVLGNENERKQVIGIDIGTGASCIYPLLGAALHSWHFVGTDFTPVALSWAQKNVEQNEHLTQLIEIRKVEGNLMAGDGLYKEMAEVQKIVTSASECQVAYNAELSTAASLKEREKCHVLFDHKKMDGKMTELGYDTSTQMYSSLKEDPMNVSQVSHKEYNGPLVLCGIVKEFEKFSFCMCNPPFFESIQEAGANPHTACGGTLEEMVCPGGELSFITRMIEDSLQLKGQIHWYTTLVGRKVNLKVLIPKLRRMGVTMLRTTEFSQGRTSRWGLAWSFTLPERNCLYNNIVLQHASGRQCISFILEGLPRQCRTDQIFQALTQHLEDLGAICQVDISSFSISGIISQNSIGQDMHPPQKQRSVCSVEKSLVSQQQVLSDIHKSEAQFNVLVFEQAPGTLLVKACLLKGENSSAGAFSVMCKSAEQMLKKYYCLKS